MSTIDIGAAPQSLADLAYEALRSRLVTLEIAPGSPINDETLAAELGVGRTPVREALKRLEQDRLVVTYARRGTFATRVEITDLAYLSEIRAELEPLAARRAARLCHPGGGRSPAGRDHRSRRPGRQRRRGHAAAGRCGGAPRHLPGGGEPVPGGLAGPLQQPGHPDLGAGDGPPRPRGRPSAQSHRPGARDPGRRRRPGRRCWRVRTWSASSSPSAPPSDPSHSRSGNCFSHTATSEEARSRARKWSGGVLDGGVEEPVGQVAGEGGPHDDRRRVSAADPSAGSPFSRTSMITGTWASRVGTAKPADTTRGCRSSAQPLASTSRAYGPEISITVRWPETSTTAPPAGRRTSASAGLVRRADEQPLVRTEPVDRVASAGRSRPAGARQPDPDQLLDSGRGRQIRVDPHRQLTGRHQRADGQG